MVNEINYIAIEGVIGVGKTSLARLIAEKMRARLILEKFEENPFLDKFYKSKADFAFQTQMFFLVSRYKQLEGLHQNSLFTNFIVSDYIFEKDRIFASINLSDEEFRLYDSIYPMFSQNIRKPDLVIFLDSDVDRLVYNVKLRNREMEKAVTADYLAALSNAYKEFFFKYSHSPLLIINTTGIDFVNNDSEFNALCKEIFRKDRAFIEYFNPEGKGIF
ncbi:MAG: deoxyadenosine kinase [Ignavibacteriales bacterium]